MVPCVSETALYEVLECVDEQTCGVRLAMKEPRDATARVSITRRWHDVNARLRASAAIVS